MRARIIHLNAGCSSLRTRPLRKWIKKSSRIGRKMRLAIRKHRELRLWRRDRMRCRMWGTIFLISIIGLICGKTLTDRFLCWTDTPERFLHYFLPHHALFQNDFNAARSRVDCLDYYAKVGVFAARILKVHLNRQISSTWTKLLRSLRSPLIYKHLWVFGDFLISTGSIKSFPQRVWQSILRILLKDRKFLFFFSARRPFKPQSFRVFNDISPSSFKSITRTRREKMTNILIIKPLWATCFFNIQTIRRDRESVYIKVMSQNSRRMV
jgi:hypothetical protein